MTAGIRTPLSCDGDFGSVECIEILHTADIVVSNPPFSRFSRYILTLMNSEKLFLVLGNQNAVTHKDIFPLIKNNLLWYGYSIHSGGIDFAMPDDYEEYSKNVVIKEDGHHYINLAGIRWFTNLDHTLRHEYLVLKKTYSNAEYPVYDNYEAINVNKTSEIPMDYNGIMGVPITFIDRYNPDQFTILGIDKELTHDHNRGSIDGNRLYARLIIQPVKEISACSV